MLNFLPWPLVGFIASVLLLLATIQPDLADTMFAPVSYTHLTLPTNREV